jgi:hypothetical protein
MAQPFLTAWVLAIRRVVGGLVGVFEVESNRSI